MSKGRIAVLIVLLLLMVSGLTVRLFSIAVLQNSQYLAKAKNQQSDVRDVFPRRGTIYLQDLSLGKPDMVVTSVPSYAISAIPRNVQKKEAYAHILAQISGGDEAKILINLRLNGLYMNPLKHGLSKGDVEHAAQLINALEKHDDATYKNVAVNFNSDQGSTMYFTGGVYFIPEFSRVYPEGPLLSQVLGFVSNDGKGKYGFEEQYDKELEGYTGRIMVQTDSLGVPLSQQVLLQGKDGTSYELSVDRNIQYVVERELAAEIKDAEAESGSVIIMNPKTGEVIAMANQPSYDPNHFRDIASDKIALFDNPAISNVWEPGSIFKPLIMSAALDTGAVKPETKDVFPESVTVDGYTIETALRKAYGEETMTQVLVNSDNVAMVWVTNKMKNQDIYDYLKKYGFGDYTGIDLRNEITGKVLAPEKWRPINRATISFGQGIAVTPLQIATAYSAIANEGKLVRPRIVHAIINPDGSRQEVTTAEGAQVIKPETAKQLRDMMVATVVNAHNRAGTEGYKIGGKTGTAQIPDPQHGGYLPDAYNHSFIGFGPADDPKYVMLVKIDHPNLKKVGLYAEGTAVPLFGRISSFLLDYYQIPPTNR